MLNLWPLRPIPAWDGIPADRKIGDSFAWPAARRDRASRHQFRFKSARAPPGPPHGGTGRVATCSKVTRPELRLARRAAGQGEPPPCNFDELYWAPPLKFVQGLGSSVAPEGDEKACRHQLHDLPFDWAPDLTLAQDRGSSVAPEGDREASRHLVCHRAPDLKLAQDRGSSVAPEGDQGCVVIDALQIVAVFVHLP